MWCIARFELFWLWLWIILPLFLSNCIKYHYFLIPTFTSVDDTSYQKCLKKSLQSMRMSDKNRHNNYVNIISQDNYVASEFPVSSTFKIPILCTYDFFIDTFSLYVNICIISSKKGTNMTNRHKKVSMTVLAVSYVWGTNPI